MRSGKIVIAIAQANVHPHKVYLPLPAVLFFCTFVSMKAMVITPRSQSEFKFLSDLMKKLNIMSATVTEEEIEDLGLSKMLKEVDKTKKVSRESIMNKLRS